MVKEIVALVSAVANVFHDSYKPLCHPKATQQVSLYSREKKDCVCLVRLLCHRGMAYRSSHFLLNCEPGST